MGNISGEIYKLEAQLSVKHALRVHEGKYQCNDKYPISHQLTVISLNQSGRPPPPLPPLPPDDGRTTTHYKKIQQQQQIHNHHQQRKFWAASAAAASASSPTDNVYRPEDVGRNGNAENWPVASSDNMPDIPPPRLPNNQYEDVVVANGDDDDDVYEFSYSPTAFSTTSTRYLPQDSYDTLYTSSTKQHHQHHHSSSTNNEDIENIFGYSRPRMTSPIIPQTTTTTLPSTTTTTTITTTAYSSTSTTTTSSTTVLSPLSPSQKGEHFSLLLITSS